MSILENLFPYSSKKAEKVMLNSLRKENFPGVGKDYKKYFTTEIHSSYGKTAKAEIKYRSTGLYRGNLGAFSNFTRYKRNGKGPWQYEVKVGLTFYGIDISNKAFASTQAEIRKQYPKVSFSFYPSGIDIYYISNTKQKGDSLQDTVRYFDILFSLDRSSIYDIMNYMYDQQHKK